MLSTICSETVYPYTDLKVCNLGSDYICVELPAFLNKAISKINSLHQLRLMGQYFFGAASQESGSKFIISLNRNFTEVASNHRFILPEDSSELIEYFKNNHHFDISYNRVLDCHESHSVKNESGTEISLEVLLNTESFILLLHPNRILCHRKHLPYLYSILSHRKYEHIDQDILVDRLFKSLVLSQPPKYYEMDFNTIYQSVRKVLSIRKRTIKIVDQNNEILKWGYNEILTSNSKAIIVRYEVEKEIGFIYVNTLTMKAHSLGMSSNYSVKEMFREFHDYCKHDRISFDID